MKASDNLFTLIKSLNKAEKGYFKKYTGLHVRKGKNTYMLLFEAIDKQKQYDEVLIKKRFHNKAFVRQLTFTKNYLYNLILKSMRMFHSQRLTEIQLKEMLVDTEFLFEKGLYEQCEKIVERALLTAEQYEHFTAYIELMKWKNKLMYARAFVGTEEKDIRELFDKIQKITEKLGNLNEYGFYESLMFVRVQKKGAVRKTSDLIAYKEIISSPLFQSEKKAQSYLAKISYYLCNCTFYQMIHEHEKSLYFIEKQIELFDRYPHQTEERKNMYIVALQNLLTSQFNCKKYNGMLSTIEKMRTVKTISNHIKSNIFFSTAMMELALYRDTGQFEKGTQLIKKIQNEFNLQLKKIISKEDVFLFDYIAACVYFGAENYSAASAMLNKIINVPTIDIRSDLYCFTRILSLIVHIESGKDDLLEYAVKSTYRFLYRRNRLYQFETLLLKFIRNKLPKISSRKELLPHLTTLKNDMKNLFENPFERKVLEYFDFISWVESKTENCSFAEKVNGKL